MNTLFFKYAIEVAKAGSITRAADNLYMGQPNLSKAIKELEDTLGIIIFKRTSKGVLLTPQGAEFLKYAKKIVAYINEIESLGVINNEERQKFSISIPRGSYIASGFIKFVSELDPEKEMDINITETNSVQTINNIVESKFDLGIIRYQILKEKYFLDYLANKEINLEPIWEFEYLAVMSQHHPLAFCEQVKQSDLKKFIEITHGDISIPYLPEEEIKKRRNPEYAYKKVYVYERSIQFELLMNIFTTYMWVSPIPEGLLKQYGLVQRRCPGANHRYKDVLIYSKDYKLSALDKKFIDKLYEAKNEVAFKNYY